MTNLGVKTERVQQLPSANSKDPLLRESQLRAATVKFIGNSASCGGVLRLIGIEEIQSDAANVDLPSAQPEFGSWEIHEQAHPLPIRAAHGFDRQLAGVIVRVQSPLIPRSINLLTKISLLIQQADCSYRHAQIAGRLQLVTGDIPEATRIDGQSFAEHELHAKVRNASHARARMRSAEPSFGVLSGLSFGMNTDQ